MATIVVQEVGKVYAREWDATYLTAMDLASVCDALEAKGIEFSILEGTFRVLIEVEPAGGTRMEARVRRLFPPARPAS